MGETTGTPGRRRPRTRRPHGADGFTIDDVDITVVVGPMRTGTTLLAELLCSHPTWSRSTTPGRVIPLGRFPVATSACWRSSTVASSAASTPSTVSGRIVHEVTQSPSPSPGVAGHCGDKEAGDEAAVGAIHLLVVPVDMDGSDDDEGGREAGVSDRTPLGVFPGNKIMSASSESPGEDGALTQISEDGALTQISEEVIVAEAQVVASRLVEWFRERLLTAEAQREVADEARVSAEQDRRVSDSQRDAAVQARVSAEDDRRDADKQRGAVERRVIEVERLLVVSEELAEQLQQALDTRIVIEQAKGFLAASYGVAPDVAFEAMRRYARTNRVALRDVAADAISGTPDLEL